MCCSISPLGATPRSARSDQVRSAAEEIEEEYIEEDISVADDLLKSDHSGVSTIHFVHHLILTHNIEYDDSEHDKFKDVFSYENSLVNEHLRLDNLISWNIAEWSIQVWLNLTTGRH